MSIFWENTDIGDLLKIRFNMKFPQFHLVPKIHDVFAGPWLGDYRFKRNDDGKVSGFVVQNVHFEKLK